MLPLLVIVATALTCTMFLTRSMMLGFPSAIFWAIVGGYFYTLSTTVWDIYFVSAFACLLGMTPFSALAAYGLREKHDTLAEEEIERGGNERYFDEEPEPDMGGGVSRQETRRRGDSSGRVTGDDELPGPSRRALEVRSRAEKRRSHGIKKKTGWGEFK